MTITPTVAAPPSTQDVAATELAVMAATTGVATDFNQGSQIRTAAESVGAVVEQQGASVLALALQAIAYSAMGLFNITPKGAIASVGTVTMSTESGLLPPPATQAVQIPQGTLIQTQGGIQVVTTQLVTLNQGSGTINVPVQAVVPGAAGNVPAGSLTQLVSSLTYPLVVTNAAPLTNGTDAETPAQALARVAAKMSSVAGGSPVGIANSVIGVTASGTTETVRYSTVYEPWIAAGSGPGSGTAGFTLYIDNGSGAASAGLITAATNVLNGSQSGGQIGSRDAGMPYSVQAVQPIYASVSVVGALNSFGVQQTVINAITDAVDAYFASLQFCVDSSQYAEQAVLAAQVANAAIGTLTSLQVTLAYAAASNVAVTAVSGLGYNRVVLQNLSVQVA